MEFRGAFESHLPQMIERLDAFKDTGYSFEEWINWELLFSLNSNGILSRPKPNYHQFLDDGKSELGDILILDRYFLEVAVVHDSTANKWIDKVDDDRRSLKRLVGGRAIPVQLLVLISRHPNILTQESWTPWLAGISFWHEKPEWTFDIPLPSGGQVVFMCWAVSEN